MKPEGGPPSERFLSSGRTRLELSGENMTVYRGCPTTPDMIRVLAFHTGWMLSPGRSENILSDGFDNFRFGIAGESNGIYAV